MKDANAELHLYTSAWEPDGGYVIPAGDWEIQSYGVFWQVEENIATILPWREISRVEIVKKKGD